MLNLNDLYTFHTSQPLIYINPSTNIKTTLGTTIISYEIRQYRNLKNLSEAIAYKVKCTQRVVIPNANPYVPGSSYVTKFLNYPVAVTNKITFPNSSLELVSYSPRTLNSSVVTSVSNSSESNSGTSSSATMQHTSGSTTSQSNSFGASASVGFFGDALTGGMSADYDHSWSSEHSKSNSLGSQAGKDASSSNQSSSNDSMSIKDWACYSSIDSTDHSPTWVWGQEYPWNIIQYRNDDNTDNIVLPNFVKPLLYDQGSQQLLPPSELSQFGVDFTMKAVWVLASDIFTPVSVSHMMSCYTASHQLTGEELVAQINELKHFTYTTPPLDLCVYGLDPIFSDGLASSAVVGFILRRFIVKPTPAVLSQGSITKPVHFKIISTVNNLLIQDTTEYGNLAVEDADAGFTSSETALSAKFTSNCLSLKMSLSFKIIDEIDNFRLYLKHWKTDAVDVMLTIVINNDEDNMIIKLVNAQEAEGGEKNLLSISLRNLDYSSVDYHDYLKLGLNTIDITITPAKGVSDNCGYQLRAISIERD
jgi:hypothetical protein